MDIVHRLRDDKIARGSIKGVWIGFSKYLNNHRPDCKEIIKHWLAAKFRKAKLCWISEIEKAH